MAFFGLTNLGSQDPFENAKITPLHAFAERDFQFAFMAVAHPGYAPRSESKEKAEKSQAAIETARITFDQLDFVLQKLYKCPKDEDNVPVPVKTLVKDGFAHQLASQEHEISLKEFIEIMKEMSVVSEQHEKEELGKVYAIDGLSSREFVSSNAFKAHLAKHERMTKDPKDKTMVPMTDSQTLGWEKVTIPTERKPKKSCEETQYASAMVKAGQYYC